MSSSQSPGNLQLTPLLDGLSFGEGPRWRDDRLWFSDFYRHVVMTVTPEGASEIVVEVPQQPSGLGWLPNGNLLIVSMLDRQLLRWDGESLTGYADLSELVAKPCNDMVVDEAGRAYVGNFGFNRHEGDDPTTTHLTIVEPDGSISRGPDNLMFPNGTVISPDGCTLIVGETMGQRLTAFDRDPSSGRLSDPRLWADLGPHFPDGICLDAENGVWVADPRNGQALRVLEGGEITDRVHCGEGRHAFACMLGGAQGTTLFVVTNTGSGPGAAASLNGRIETVEVAVPAAGLP